MVRSPNNVQARALSASKQLDFQPLLVAARKTRLASAVSAAASECDQKQLRLELSKLGDAKVLRIAANAKIRDEHVVITPCLLKQRPTTIGYYRLLVGLSKKQFYDGSTGFGALKSMEEANSLPRQNGPLLEKVCATLNKLIADLVTTLDEKFTSDDVRELPLLQLGAQFDGAHRVTIGEAAATEVFSAIGEILKSHVKVASSKRLELIDATGVRVVIKCASDPDIEIARDDGSNRPRRIAVEIKGGTDLSNAHNRAGEAEKSHFKAKAKGYTEFWTIASLPKSRQIEFKSQSPTTGNWFDLSEILGRAGASWDEFRKQISTASGVRLAPKVGRRTAKH